MTKTVKENQLARSNQLDQKIGSEESSDQVTKIRYLVYDEAYKRIDLLLSRYEKKQTELANSLSLSLSEVDFIISGYQLLKESKKMFKWGVVCQKYYTDPDLNNCIEYHLDLLEEKDSQLDSLFSYDLTKSFKNIRTFNEFKLEAKGRIRALKTVSPTW